MTQIPAELAAIYAKLQGIRQRKDLKLRPTHHLVETFRGLDKVERPLKLRYYQVQGVFHLLAMKRFVLGDDTGLGKTLETIATLCYIWEKDPQRKVVILTTKSAVNQWAKEFSRFTREVDVTVVKALTPVKRAAVREAFYTAQGSHPQVLVMNYALARTDFSFLQEWTDYVLILDECFHYHTPVTLADGTMELIGKIVSQRQPVEVLSWNVEKGCVEPCKVVDWHRNPLVRGSRKSLLSLSFQYGGNVRVTRNHKFALLDGTEVEAGKLQKGSSVSFLCQSTPTKEQWQIVLGGLLGDSCLSHPDRTLSGVVFCHSEKQQTYLEYKREVLSSLGVSEIRFEPSGYNADAAKGGRFRLHGNPALASFFESARIWSGKRKRVTLSWLDRINPLGLAVWYADDGSLSTHTTLEGVDRYSISIHTSGFSLAEQELLCGWLRWKWGVHAEIKSTKERSDREGVSRKSYPYLYLPHDSAVLFLSLLPGAFPGVEYKFPGRNLLNLGLQTPVLSLILDHVVEKKVWEPAGNSSKYVYNLEVEGNHNYFANGLLVTNCTAVKNPSAQIHKVCKHLAGKAQRVWGLTATLIKNNLIEGYGIYKVVAPWVFEMSKTDFMRHFCVTKMQRIAGSNRQIPVVVGYRKKDILRFKETIDPYFIGRAKHDVDDELPTLLCHQVDVGLTSAQQELYAEALSGVLQVGEGDNADHKEVSQLTAIIYCQQVVNHPSLLSREGDSKKFEALLDMLTEGDLADEKVIVFSRFRKMIDLIAPALNARHKGKKKYCVRITGAETSLEREEAQDAFQDLESDTRVVCITMAGSDAINLQAAKAIIFYDTPWSAGDYLQILGRMIRIGSLHKSVFAIHLISRDTVDDRVMAVLLSKMGLVESVLGKKLKGLENDGDPFQIAQESGTKQLFESLWEDASKLAKRAKGGV